MDFYGSMLFKSNLELWMAKYLNFITLGEIPNFHPECTIIEIQIIQIWKTNCEDDP